MKLTLKIKVILYTSCKSEVTIVVTSNRHAAILRDAISRHHSYCSVTGRDISLVYSDIIMQLRDATHARIHH